MKVRLAASKAVLPAVLVALLIPAACRKKPKEPPPPETAPRAEVKATVPEIVKPEAPPEDPRLLEIRERIDDPEPEARAEAILGVAEVGERGRDLLPRVREALADRSAEVRVAAVRTLLKLEGAQALPSLRVALKDADPDVRTETLQALADLKDRAVLPDLKAALQDPDEEVRFSALVALRRSFEEEPIAREVAAMLKDALRGALIQKGLEVLIDFNTPPETDLLVDLLNRPAMAVRLEATKAIISFRLATQATLGALLYNLKDEEFEVRRQSAFALRTLTGQDFGFDVEQGEEKMDAARVKWEEWWDKNKEKYK